MTHKASVSYIELPALQILQGSQTAICYLPPAGSVSKTICCLVLFLANLEVSAINPSWSVVFACTSPCLSYLIIFVPGWA